MDVKTAIQTRRAYRSLAPATINNELIDQLAQAASLAPSCFNKQPWQFVFIYDPDVLIKMRRVMSRGNEWTAEASMIIAVLSKKEYDCAMKDGREYYLFDTGMAVAQMILLATELGLVAHPIAGYDPVKVRETLAIPEDLSVVTLINIGKHAETIGPALSPEQAQGEKERPLRKKTEEFAYHNIYPKH